MQYGPLHEQVLSTSHFLDVSWTNMVVKRNLVWPWHCNQGLFLSCIVIYGIWPSHLVVITRDDVTDDAIDVKKRLGLPSRVQCLATQAQSRQFRSNTSYKLKTNACFTLTFVYFNREISHGAWIDLSASVLHSLVLERLLSNEMKDETCFQHVPLRLNPRPEAGKQEC